MNQPTQDPAFILRALLAAAHITASIAAAEAMSRFDAAVDPPRLVCFALAMAQISLASIWVVTGRTLALLRWGALIALFGLWLPLLWRDFEDNYVLLNNMVWQ